MEYAVFSAWFTAFHIAAYTIAGMIALSVSREIYHGRNRTMTYLRDMSDAQERAHVEKWSLLAQIPRGLLMSVALYPVLGSLGDLSFALRFAFFAGLMFIFTHISSAAPCADNIEGFVYMKEEFLARSSFLKFQMEMVIYSTLFALPSAHFLF